MSVSFPRRLVAALLTILLLGALPLPVAGATASDSDPGSDGVTTPTPWWVDWLEAFDLNNNRIDDGQRPSRSERC